MAQSQPSDPLCLSLLIGKWGREPAAWAAGRPGRWTALEPHSSLPCWGSRGGEGPEPC